MKIYYNEIEERSPRKVEGPKHLPFYQPRPNHDDMNALFTAYDNATHTHADSYKEGDNMVMA